MVGSAFFFNENLESWNTLITTVVVPLISVVVIVLFYFFGADVEDKVGAEAMLKSKGEERMRFGVL